MATIKPFKGIRPPKDLVEKVECRPYDVLDSEEARAEAGDNEMSLYHITKPEIDFAPGTSEYDPRVYEKAAENFESTTVFAPNLSLFALGKYITPRFLCSLEY